MKTIQELSVLALFCASVTCCHVALANDSAMRTAGGGSVEVLSQHPSIRMLSESVDIKLGRRIGWKWPAFVRCEFHLRNEGRATEVLIGFPEKAWADTSNASATGRLIGFRSWVDGAPVRLRYRSAGVKGDTRRGTEHYDAWYTKRVHFAAGQTRRITDVYFSWMGYLASSSPTQDATFLLEYVLTTGASWKGRIGRAAIRVDASEAGPFWSLRPSPNGCHQKGSRLAWLFTDFDPGENIHVELVPRLPLLNGKRMVGLGPYFTRGCVAMVTARSLEGAGAKVAVDPLQCEIAFGCHRLRFRDGSRTAVLDARKVALATAPRHFVDRPDFLVPIEETVRLLGGKASRTDSGELNLVLPRPVP